MSEKQPHPADLQPQNNPPPLDILAQLPDGVWVIEADAAQIIWCNETAAQLFGMQAKEFINQHVPTFEKAFFGTQEWGKIAALIIEKGTHTFFSRKTRAGQAIVSIETHVKHYVENGKNYFIAILRDIKNRIAAEQNTQSENLRLAFALNEAFDGMWDWDIQSNELFFSPSMKKMLGYPLTENHNYLDSWVSNIHPDDKEATLAILNDHLERRRERYEAQYRLRNRLGEYQWMHDRGRVCLRDEQGRPLRMVGVLHNIHEQKKLELSLRDLALHDALTGLPNRHKAENFFHYLSQTQENQINPQPICIAIIDLDFFKRINDVYGHPIGDKVLITAGHIFRKNLRTKDFVARWGGEEFLIVLPETDLKTAQAVVTRIFSDFHQYNWARETGVPYVSFSMGLTQVASKNQLDFYETVSQADRALYEAKSAGRARCVIVDNDTFHPMDFF